MESVAIELQRIRRRWRGLPEPVARESASLMRDLAQQLADDVRGLAGEEPLVIPDLGEAALVDQLTVMAYDACRAGLQETVLTGLIALRRSLP